MRVRDAYARYDAERKFSVPALKIADPKSRQCGEVLKGVIKPWDGHPCPRIPNMYATPLVDPRLPPQKRMDKTLTVSWTWPVNQIRAAPLG